MTKSKVLKTEVDLESGIKTVQNLYKDYPMGSIITLIDFTKELIISGYDPDGKILAFYAGQTSFIKLTIHPKRIVSLKPNPLNKDEANG